MYITNDNLGLNYERLSMQGTGAATTAKDCKVVECRFDRYLVQVVLSSTNEFIGIREIKVNQDFRSLHEKMANSGFHQVDEFYRDK